MYNVLEKLRTETSLNPKEGVVHQQGLVSVLRELHDELDEIVSEAYGWPAKLDDDAVLGELVALNAERVAEEARGHVRWLRPAYQQPQGTAQQAGMGLEEDVATASQLPKQSWPKSLPEQAQAVRSAVSNLNQPATSAAVAKQFRGARADRVGELLETLALLGQVRVTGPSQYAP